MAGSSYGNQLGITTWGESHGPGIGVVLDGFPAGMNLCAQDIQKYLDRRKPGQSAATTSRKEDDLVEILSGVFEGRTTGTPISLMVRNTSQHSADYEDIAHYYRPGHADYTFDMKYGFRDYRGGGRSSGRETIGRVAAGAVCAKLLSEMGVLVCAYTRSIGPVSINEDHFDAAQILKSPSGMPDAEADAKAMAYIASCREKQDSVGGVIECRIDGVPAGIGDPVFRKLDAMLADGFLQEMQQLRQRGDLHLDLPSMRCVGYRQAWEALDSAAAHHQSVDMPSLREKGIAATRQLAKRQITWLRSMPQRQTIACDAPQAQATLVARALAACRAI